MVPVFMSCMANLRKKKVQTAFTALIILLSTLLFSTAIAVVRNTGDVFTEIHRKVAGSHQILKFERDLNDPQEIYSWWRQQSGVIASEPVRYRHLTGITSNGKDIPNIYLYMMDTPARSFSVDKLLFAQGSEDAMPAAGTVWIPTTVAYSNHIAVGETIGFQTEQGEIKLNVSAVVVDVPFCAPFSTSARIWMNGSDFERLFSPAQGKDMYMMGLRFDDYGENRTYWERLEQHMGAPFLEATTEYESIASFYLVTNKIIGLVMIVLAVIMILIALFTIGFTISDAIVSNYKTIGVVKSLGLSPIKTVGVYVMQYALISAVSIIPGIALSYLFAKTIVTSSLSFLKTGTSQINLYFFESAICVALLILLIIISASVIFSYKTRSIQPVQAIRYGMSESDVIRSAKRIKAAGNGRFALDRLPPALALGLRGILKNRKGSYLMAFISALTTSVMVFGLILILSISSIKQTIALWGYDRADVTMRIDDESLTFDELKEEYLSQDSVQNFGRYGDINAVIPAEKSHDGVETNSMGILVGVVEGSYDEIGFTNLRGRNPENDSEIAIGINVSKKYQKDIGDVMALYIEGKKCTFTITGVYQAIANMSYSARITVDAVQRINPDYDELNIIFVNLQENVSPDGYVKDAAAKYGDSIWATTHETLINSVFSQAAAMLILPMSILGVLFLAVTFVIIFSICSINVKRESKTYGIYKSIGMSSGNIRKSITLGVAIVSAIGVLIGIPAGIYGVPLILNIILSSYGIVKMPLIINWAGILAVMPVSVVAAGLGSWFASRIVRRTSPRILVVE